MEADAKRAEGASEATLRIPSPPALTGRLAGVHWMSDKSELLMRQRPLCRGFSNLTKRSLPARGEQRRICAILGALEQALSRLEHRVH